MRLKESEKEWGGTKMQMEERDVPLGSRRWKPLPEGSSWTWILETLGSCSGGGKASVFLNREGSRGATEEVQAEKKMEIYITFARGQNGDSIHRLIGRFR